MTFWYNLLLLENTDGLFCTSFDGDNLRCIGHHYSLGAAADRCAGCRGEPRCCCGMAVSGQVGVLGMAGVQHTASGFTGVSCYSWQQGKGRVAAAYGCLG